VSDTSSYITVDSSRVVDACNRWLEQRQRRIDTDMETAIQKQMTKRFFRAKTREQATQRLEEFYRQLRWNGSYWEGRVISLKHQAQAAPTIMLSTDDHSLICNGDGHLA
jgi:formyltetrahydrofolate hydrolase